MRSSRLAVIVASKTILYIDFCRPDVSLTRWKLCALQEPRRNWEMMLSAMPNITHCKSELLSSLLWGLGIDCAYSHRARAALRYQFIIDSLDVWLPATNLGFVNFNDGILGFTGSVLPLKYAKLVYPKRIIYPQNCHVSLGCPQAMAIRQRKEVTSYLYCGDLAEIVFVHIRTLIIPVTSSAPSLLYRFPMNTRHLLTSCAWHD